MTVCHFEFGGSLVETKWCHYVMVEVDIHFNLLPTSILDMQRVWAHWYADHWQTVAVLHSYTHPTWLKFWSSVSLVESKWCHLVSWLRLPTTPQTAFFIRIRHIQSVWAHWYAVHWHISAALHSLTTLLDSDFGVLCHLWSQKNDVILCHDWGRKTTSNCFPYPY